MLDKKFKVLRVVAALYKVLAWILAVVGLIAALAILVVGIFGGGALRSSGFRPDYFGPYGIGFQAPILTGVVGFLVTLLVTALSFVLLYSVGEFVLLGLAIEENTRETAYYLRGEGTLPPEV